MFTICVCSVSLGHHLTKSVRVMLHMQESGDVISGAHAVMEPRRKRRRASKHVRNYLREFSEGTSLHGVRYVGEQNRHWAERACWAAAVLVCTVICALEMHKVLTRYKVSPIITTFSQYRTRVGDVVFPAVSVCPTLQVTRDNFDLDLLHDNLTSEERLKLETAHLLCDNLRTESEQLYFIPNTSHFNTVPKLTMHPDEVITDCRWVSGSSENCHKQFRPILTNTGICYTFNMQSDENMFVHPMYDMNWSNVEPPSPIRNASAIVGRANSGLKLLFRIPEFQHQSGCHSAKYDLSEISFKVYLHPPDDFPQSAIKGDMQSVLIPPWSDVSVRLRPVITTTDFVLHDHDADIRGCRYTDSQPLHVFKSYSAHNCEVECESWRLEQECSCSPYNLPLDPANERLQRCAIPDSTDKCNPIRTISQPAMCDYCLPSCDEVRYETTVILSDISRHQLEDEVIFNVTANRSQKLDLAPGYNFSRLNIYFEDREYLGIRRSEVFSFTDVLSNCGGLLGLFTGFSVLTLVEVLYFATLRIFCNLQRNRVKTSDEDMTPEAPVRKLKKKIARRGCMKRN